MALQEEAPKPQSKIDQRAFFPKNLEAHVLSHTNIGFLDEFVIFKTPHNVLGFYCTGTVTTIAKLDLGSETPIVFDQLNTLCDSCDGRTVFPLRGEETIQAIKTTKKLEEIKCGQINF